MRLDTKLLLFVSLVILLVNQFYISFSYLTYPLKFKIFLLPLIWPGLAHGSLDIIIARRLNLVSNNRELFIFTFVYISISILIICLWLVIPNYVLITFLVISIIHFGASDSLKEDKDFFFDATIRGITPISTPIYFYSEEVKFIFRKLNAESSFIENLIKYNDFLFYSLILLIIIYSARNFYFKKKDVQTLFEILLILSVFCLLDPFTAFCLYFCFFHSLRHLLLEKDSLNLSINEVFYKTLPLTGLSFCGIIMIYFFFSEFGFNYLSLIFVSLSALTVPHMLLVNKYRIPNN